MTTRPLVDLYSLTRAELGEALAGWGVNPVHAGPVWRALYWDCVRDFDEMRDGREGREVPPRVCAVLAERATLGVLPTVLAADSSDGFTRKFLLGLHDGERIETVLMRYTGRVTACVSSQVGCAMGCVFCATGQRGYTRHLSAGEIVAQAVHVQRVLLSGSDGGLPPIDTRLGLRPRARAGESQAARLRLRNIVLMGMGEPLHNYDEVMRAVDILSDGTGLAIAAERITLSTVGVVPGILRLSRERRRVHLAVSLHAASQEERAAIVPTARKWPLPQLIDACRTYSMETGRRIFYEWTLIEGENDSPEQARAVGHLLAGLPAQVNLIPLNPTEGYAGTATRREAARAFQRVLIEEFGIPSTVRQRRGIDIAAGCGQLAAAVSHRWLNLADRMEHTDDGSAATSAQVLAAKAVLRTSSR